MKKYKSLAKGWVSFQDIQTLFNTNRATMRNWKHKYPECFEVINQKYYNVNARMLNDRVKRVTETDLIKFLEG